MTVQAPVPFINTKQLTTCLDIAGRDSSADGEALAAMRHARKTLANAGMTFADLVGSGAHPQALTGDKGDITVAYEQVRRRLHRAESDLLAEKRHNERLSTEVERLTAALETEKEAKLALERKLDDIAFDVPNAEVQPEPAPAAPAATPSAGPAPVDGFYTFAQFKRAVTEQIALDHGWVVAFCQQTGYEDHTVQNWRQRGKVPAEAFDKIATLSAPVKERKKDWTETEKESLRALKDEDTKLRASGKPGLTIKVIAEKLTQEFGRLITPNSIKGQWDRIRVKD